MLDLKKVAELVKHNPGITREELILLITKKIFVERERLFRELAGSRLVMEKDGKFSPSE